METRNEKEIINEMMSNTLYIEWLVQFLQNKNSFSDRWLFIANQSDPNREYVKKLGLFYQGIDNYAKDNHIYPTIIECKHFYGIKYNGVSLQIGFTMGQEGEFFCNKVPLANEKSFIDFNDIINNKRQDNVDGIDETLDYLSDEVIAAYERGIPLEAIITTLDETIRNISKEEKNKQKIISR